MRQITGGDAFWIWTETETVHQHLSIVYIYDQSELEEPLRFKTILQHVEERLGASPIFRQKLLNVPFNLDYPYWVNDPNFDLEFHVRHIALPQPGDWRQLCIQLSRLHSRPLDMRRPVWEMYVIEGLDNVEFLPKNSFALMLKVHHVAMDGVTGAEVSFDLHDTEPQPGNPRRKRHWRPTPQPKTSELLARAVTNNARALFRTVEHLGEQVTNNFRGQFSDNNAEQKPAELAPLTRFSQDITPYRVWDAVSFDLSDFKIVKDSIPGATINDVVLAICGGSVTRYLKSKNEAPETPLTAMIPISMRAADEIDTTGGNKVALVKVSLCSLEANPLERLRQISAQMQQIKEESAVSARDMMQFQAEMPATTMLMAMKTLSAHFGPGKKFREQHNMLITNVPGPQQPLYFCGAKLAMFTGMSLISDQIGLSHAIVSYNGKVVMSALSDRAMMPDPAFYADCIRSSFEELKSAATKAVTGAGKPRKPEKRANPAAS